MTRPIIHACHRVSGLRAWVGTWLWACLFLLAGPSAVFGMGPVFRLQGANQYFVTLDEADEAAAQTAPGARWTLKGRHGFTDRRILVDRDRQLLAFVDAPSGLGVRMPLVMSFQEYYAARSRADFRRLWSQNLQQYITRTASGQDKKGLLSLDLPVELPSIFGGGTPNFSLTGNQRIELAGRSEWTDGQVRTATNRVSKFPTLQMKQQQQFTVTGTIGEKVSVIIKQDSQAFSDLDNNISLRYEDKTEDGRDGNGIIKRFEAGNVTLSLENAEFTGYTDQHSGLFGLKMESKLGSLGITGILSQEKGEGQSATFQAGAQASTNQIRDLDYRRRTYFFVDPEFRENFSRRNPNGIHVAADDSIEAIRVFVADFGSRLDRANIRKAAAYWQPPRYFGGTLLDPPDSVVSGRVEVERGDFRELQSTEFFVDRNLGYIALSNPLQPTDVLAVYYITRNRRTTQRFEYGNVPELNDESTEAKLRLLKSRNENPPAADAINDPNQWGIWQYEWRNVYFLGKTDINPQGFDLKVYRKSPGGVDQDVDETGVPYIQLLGLDRRGIEPGSPPDRLMDIDYDLINFPRGELIFPDLYPFAPGLLSGNLAFPATQQSGLTDQTPELYTQRTAEINANIANFQKYYMAVQYKDRQAQYSLGRTNIIEGSEVVRLNGRKLSPNVDYIMLYEVGQIRFLSEEALNPNANVAVDYQYAPFFKPASNTLMGLQGKYELNEKSWVRGTFLYRSEKTLDQKARVGREAGRSILWDVDTRLNFKPEFMTALVNALPFVNVQAPSSLLISGELAQSIPNPNTRGDAFIDDFEGSKEETDLGVRRSGWAPASPPTGKPHLERGRLVWYNPWEQVAVREIYPKREVIAQDSRQHVLTLEFDPGRADLRWGGAVDSAFVAAWSLDDPATRRFRWAGVMRPLTGASIDQTRSKFIEVWVNGNRGELRIDLGSISEDVNENAQFDTEDSIRVGLRNNQLDEGEDTGLDGMRDAQELGLDPAGRRLIPYDAASNPDPHGDNWAFDPSPASRGRYEEIDYNRINGTENTINDPDRGRRPDSEDINGSGFMDTKDDYFHYAIDLSPEHQDTAFVSGGDLNRTNWEKSTSWRLYRIPLVTNAEVNPSFKGKTGSPSFALIEAARIWVTGVDSPVTIRIASISIVGSRWQVDAKGAIVDTTGRTIPDAELIQKREALNVTVKNTFDNPEDYVSPPGAIIEFDRVTRVQHREQSLVLTYENLQPKHTGQAFQTFFNDQDYTLYNDLRLFVHGSSSFTGDESPEFFLRFGSSLSDYYEYRTTLAPGWDPQNAIRIIFNDLTLLKGDTQSSRLSGTKPDTSFTIRLTDGQDHLVVVRAGTVPNMKQAIIDLGNGREYRVQGTPSLSKVRQFLIGVSNPYEHPLDQGEVWLDELRVSNVRRDTGMAGRLSVDAVFSDFMTVRGTLRRMDSHYRLIGKPEAGSTTTLMDLNSSLNAEKFFPKDWGLAIPVTMAWQHNTQLPRLQVGSDIVLLRETQRREQRTESARSQFSVNLSKRAKSKHILTAWTIDRFRANYATAVNTSRTITREDTTSTYNGAFNYDLSPRSPRAFSLLKWADRKFVPKLISEMKFTLIPSQFVLDARVDRTRQAGVDRLHGRGRTARFTRNLQRTVQAKMSPLTGVNVDYNLSLTNDMRADSTISLKRLKFGREIDYTQSFGIDYRPDVVAWLRPSYSFTSGYRENRNPELLSIGTSPDERTVNLNNKRTIRSSLNVARMLTSAFGRPSGGAKKDQDKNKKDAKDIKDTKDTKDKDKAPGAGGKAWRGVVAFTGVLSPVDFTYSQDRSQSRFGLRSRPSLKFQLGFSEETGVIAPLVSPPTGGTQSVSIQRDRETSSDNLSLSTGVKFFSNLEVMTRPRWTTSMTRSTSVTVQTRSRSWPDLAVRWGPSFSKMPRLQAILRRVDVSSGYSRKIDQSTNTNLAAPTLPAGSGVIGRPENRTVSQSYAPLIEVTTSWVMGLTAKAKYDVTITDQRSGLSGTDTRLQNRTLTVSLDHQVKPGFVLPIGRKKKRLEGNLRMQGQMIKSSTLSLLSRDHKHYQPSNGQDQLSFKVQSNYDFSRRVRGGLNIEWTNTENSVTHEKRRIRQGGFTVEFEFN